MSILPKASHHGEVCYAWHWKESLWGQEMRFLSDQPVTGTLRFTGLRSGTTKYVEVLGIPFVKIVSSAGPRGKWVMGSELKLVFDQPSLGSSEAKTTSLL
jgi:hypothetical protein